MKPAQPAQPAQPVSSVQQNINRAMRGMAKNKSKTLIFELPIIYHFYITVTAEEYQTRMEKFNSTAPAQFIQTQEKMLKKLAMCNREFLCKEGTMYDKTVYVNVADRTQFIPKSLIKKEIPLDEARVQYAEFFI